MVAEAMRRLRAGVGRTLRRGRVRAARRAELEGDWVTATALFEEIGDGAEAARLVDLRAEATHEPRERLALLLKAESLGGVAPERARRRALLMLDLAVSGEVRRTPRELGRLGLELEALGLPREAAEAHRLAGDPEAENGALAAAGAVSALERRLFEQQLEENVAARRDAQARSCRDLLALGRRREALALLDALGGSADAVLASELRARRLLGPVAPLELDGEPKEVALGDEVTIGRGEASIALSSPAVSRRHVALGVGERGPEVRDLGSSNGTWLRGARLEGNASIGAGIEVALGNEVPVGIRPWGARGVVVSVAGKTVFAPLGPLKVGSLAVTLGSDGWVEVRGDPQVVLHDLLVGPRIELCVGDVVREHLGGAARVRAGR